MVQNLRECVDVTVFRDNNGAIIDYYEKPAYRKQKTEKLYDKEIGLSQEKNTL